jgi:hypothetical protein
MHHASQVLVPGSNRPRSVRAPRATNDSGDLDLDLDSLTPDIDGDLKSLQVGFGVSLQPEGVSSQWIGCEFARDRV